MHHRFLCLSYAALILAGGCPSPSPEGLVPTPSHSPEEQHSAPSQSLLRQSSDGPPAVGPATAAAFTTALCDDDAKCPRGAFCHLGRRHCVADCSPEDALPAHAATGRPQRCTPRGRVTHSPEWSRGSEVAFFRLAELPRELVLAVQDKVPITIERTDGPVSAAEVMAFSSPDVDILCSPGPKEEWSNRCSFAWEAMESAMTGTLSLRARSGGATRAGEVFLTSPQMRPTLHRIELGAQSTPDPAIQGYVGRATDAGGSTSAVAVVAHLEGGILTLSDNGRHIFGPMPLQFPLGANTSAAVPWLREDVELARRPAPRTAHPGSMTAVWTARGFEKNPHNGALQGEVHIGFSFGDSLCWLVTLYPTTSVDLDSRQVSSGTPADTSLAATNTLTTGPPGCANKHASQQPVPALSREIFKHLRRGHSIKSQSDYIFARFSHPNLWANDDYVPCLEMPVISTSTAHRLANIRRYVNHAEETDALRAGL